VQGDAWLGRQAGRAAAPAAPMRHQVGAASMVTWNPRRRTNPHPESPRHFYPPFASFLRPPRSPQPASTTKWRRLPARLLPTSRPRRPRFGKLVRTRLHRRGVLWRVEVGARSHQAIWWCILVDTCNAAKPCVRPADRSPCATITAVGLAPRLCAAWLPARTLQSRRRQPGCSSVRRALQPSLAAWCSHRQVVACLWGGLAALWATRGSFSVELLTDPPACCFAALHAARRTATCRTPHACSPLPPSQLPCCSAPPLLPPALLLHTPVWMLCRRPMQAASLLMSCR